MAKMASGLDQLKESVKQLQGKEVIIRLKEQRGKIQVHQGIISKTFLSYFVFSKPTFSKTILNNSYTYADILTNEISIQSVEDPSFIIENNAPIVEAKGEGLEIESELLLEEEDEDEIVINDDEITIEGDDIPVEFEAVEGDNEIELELELEEAI